MTVVFGISLCVASARFAQWFRATTEAQLSLAARTQELDQTNMRLTAEISSHRCGHLIHSLRPREWERGLVLA
jgi:hypothetical protein